MQRRSSAASVSSIASFGDRPFPHFGPVIWNTLVSPRLRKFLRDQQFLVFIGALVYLALWALRAQTTFLTIMVMSVCIGNVLNAVMGYACRSLVRRSRSAMELGGLPPLAGRHQRLRRGHRRRVSFTRRAAPGVTYLGVFRMTAPFSMVVSMTVGTVWYAVTRIQLRLREKNLQLETALEAESTAVRKQEQELARARQIQQDLLPKSIPQLRGMQVAGAWQPASTVSGDYYDVMALDDNRLAICIGDVVGKGITRRPAHGQPAGGVPRLRHRRRQSRRRLQQAECLHVRQCCQRKVHILLLLHRGRTRSFTRLRECRPLSGATGAPLRRDPYTVGRRRRARCAAGLDLQDNRLQLESGDRLVLFTDGVTEAEDALGVEFGEERVVSALMDAGTRSAEDVQRKLMEAVTAYCGGQFRDDATVVVLAVQ